MKNIILAWGGTALLALTGASVFFRKNISKILKVISIAREILDILDEGAQDLADGKLTPAEIQKIEEMCTKLKGDLKK